MARRPFQPSGIGFRSNETDILGGPFAPRGLQELLQAQLMMQQLAEQSEPLRPEQRAGRAGALAQESRIAGLRSGLEQERAEKEPAAYRQAKGEAAALPLNIMNLQRLEEGEGPIRRRKAAEETGELGAREREKQRALLPIERERAKSSKEIAEIQAGTKAELQGQAEEARRSRESHNRQLQDIASLAKSTKSATERAQLMQRYFELAQQGGGVGGVGGVGGAPPPVTGSVLAPDQRQEIEAMLRQRGLDPTEERVQAVAAQLGLLGR